MAIPKFKDVLYEETGSIATVTLNRPDQLNAIRVGMYEEIAEAILHAGWNKDIGVIVHVLVTLCDLAIASESAQFGQVGPKVGSVDPGFGTALLARVVGEKKAREMWMLCRRYSAQQALEMGLINAVVEPAELDAEVERWCAEIASLSPTAIAIAKRSFNQDSESIRGISAMGMQALSLFYQTEESREGVKAFLEKRKPKFR